LLCRKEHSLIQSAAVIGGGHLIFSLCFS